MEATLTKNFINAATAAETEKAKKDWGPTYHSEHEAWAILKEEVEEAAEEEKTIQDCLNALWNAIRQGTAGTPEEQPLLCFSARPGTRNRSRADCGRSPEVP